MNTYNLINATECSFVVTASVGGLGGVIRFFCRNLHIRRILDIKILKFRILHNIATYGPDQKIDLCSKFSLLRLTQNRTTRFLTLQI